MVVVPFLLLAFVILYFFPERSATNFAWGIKPAIMAAFIGAGYLGGAYQFVMLIFGREWHRYGMAFTPVMTFTVAMLGATLLHWDRFDVGHFPFQLWLILYVVTPVLVTWLWWNNRRVDPRTPAPDDPLVPVAVNRAFGVAGVATLVGALAIFIRPQFAVEIWPWPLTALTARVLAGWFALMGVGSLILAGERRWSACRIALQSFCLWHALVLLAAIRHAADFGQSGVLNGYVLSTISGLIAMVSIYLVMESRRRAAEAAALHPN